MGLGEMEVRVWKRFKRENDERGERMKNERNVLYLRKRENSFFFQEMNDRR